MFWVIVFKTEYSVLGEVRILKFAHQWFAEVRLLCALIWGHTERQHDFLSSKNLLHLEYMQGTHWPWCVVNKAILNKKNFFCFCCCLLFLKLMYSLSRLTCYFFLVLQLIYTNCFSSICFMYFHLVTYPSKNYNIFWCGSIQQLHYILGLIDLLSCVVLLAGSAFCCALFSLWVTWWEYWLLIRIFCLQPGSLSFHNSTLKWIHVLGATYKLQNPCLVLPHDSGS